MKLLILLALFFVACTKSTPLTKPTLTLEEFDKQANTLKSVLMKFIQDNDPKVVHDVTLAMESTFALNCIPVEDECNEYHTIVTSIIQATQDKKFTLEEKMTILKKIYEMEKTLEHSRIKLIEDWKYYK